jgi:hypothetical protein
MKRCVLALLIFLPSSIYGTSLPDACGNEKVSFEIRLQKNAPAPPPTPDDGKARLFFIEKSEKPPAFIGCMNCRTDTRYGVDGGWVGATKNNSYFYISLEPGNHHLCVVRGKSVDAEPLTVEAGKTYYFQVEYNAEGTQYGSPDHPNYQVKKNVGFSMLNEDDGKYRVKISALSVATPKP